MSIPDRQDFGPLARHYQCRPGYPDDLFDFLASKCRRHDYAWDCATGNGQAARSLASRFAQVVATDVSPEQIKVAQEAPDTRIQFRVAAAEVSGIKAGSVDLVTVAQAVHWFDLVAFSAEVQRVLRIGGVLAVWCYRTPTVCEGIRLAAN